MLSCCTNTGIHRTFLPVIIDEASRSLSPGDRASRRCSRGGWLGAPVASCRCLPPVATPTNNVITSLRPALNRKTSKFRQTNGEYFYFIYKWWDNKRINPLVSNFHVCNREINSCGKFIFSFQFL